MKTIKFLFLMIFAGAIASCKKDSTTTTTSSSSSSSSSSTANIGGTTTGDDTYNPAVIAVSGCTVNGSGIDNILCLVDAFEATLTSSQISTLQQTYSKTTAERWSNLPQALVASSYKRVGLNFGSMTTTQIQHAKALIKAVTGTTTDEGWDEQQQLLNADQYLNVNGGGSDYGAANYYIAFLGTPAATGTFEIMYGGHHTAFANTYKNGALVGATPSFRGVEPFATFTWNGTTNQPLQQEQAAFTAMLTGLSSTQLATAKLSSTYSDLVVGPQEDGNFPTAYSGIQCSALSTTQKALVMAAIATYVGDIAGADAITTKYSNELDNTYIAYSGTTALVTKNDYVRIDGPSVWIEYSVQNGIVLSATHPHSVWRDKNTDYGGN
jgi:hypothetical protein